MLGLVFVLAAAGLGYGLGRWRMAPSLTPQAGTSPVRDSSATVSEALPKSTTRSVITELKGAKRLVSSLKVSAEPKVIEAPTYYSSDTVAPPAHGFQRIVPPESPPAYLAPSVPPVQTLTELLYGQQLVAKTLVANYGWIVEPGEIIDLRVDQVWDDPARFHAAYTLPSLQWLMGRVSVRLASCAITATVPREVAMRSVTSCLRAWCGSEAGEP
jgi:hypothetical protein